MNNIPAISATPKMGLQSIPDPNVFIAKIQNAYHRGVFNPYEQELKDKANSWGSNNWLDRIQKLAKGIQAKDIEKSYLLACYLFTIAVDPDITEEDKKSVFLDLYQNQSLLEEKAIIDLSHTMKYCPLVMSINILRYSPDDFWHEAFQYIAKLQICSDSYESIICSWIQTTLRNTWASEEKQAFLDRIFDLLPQEIGNESIYYFLLKDKCSWELQKVCSAALSFRIKALTDEVNVFFVRMLADLDKTEEPISIPFKEENQRHYFLEFFFKLTLDYPKSDLIAAAFDKNDWNWLRERFNRESYSSIANLVSYSTPSVPGPNLLTYTMKWIVDMARRMKMDTHSREFYSAGRSLLFYASYHIDKEKWGKDISGLYNDLAEALTPENLYYFLDAFQGDFPTQIINNIAHKEPMKILTLLKLIHKFTEDDKNQKISQNIAGLFRLIIASNGLDIMIPLIFNDSNPLDFQLTVFVSLNKELQETLLKHILTERPSGIRKLSDWVKLCCLRSRLLKPYVKDSLADNLYSLLKKIDSSMPLELKTELRSSLSLKDSPQALEILDQLLPVELDTNDPLARQQQALHKLRQLFLTPDISAEDREKFINKNSEDLNGNQTPSQRAEQLFRELPKETWPLIVLHFKYLLYHARFSNIEVYAQTLIEMAGNHLITSKNDPNDSQFGSALKDLYILASKAKIIRQVIQRFIETTPCEKFIPTMNRLSRSQFYNESGEFKSLVAECLAGAKVDKTAFIASCLKAQKEMNTTSNTFGNANLEHDLWEDPILKEDNERASVAKKLISDMGHIPFLGYFSSYNRSNLLMIKSLKNTDASYCQELFGILLKGLCLVDKSISEKLFAFQNICYVYMHAGMDVLDLLAQDKCKDLLPTIKSWYQSSEILAQHLSCDCNGLSLLKALNSDLFYPTIFNKLEAILTNQRYVSIFEIGNIFEALETIGCISPVFEKLFNEHTRILELLKIQLDKTILEDFGLFKNKHLFRLMNRLIPDWQERLISWTKEEIKKEKEQSLRFGSKSRFHRIVTVFKILSNVGQLDEWLKLIREKTSPELNIDLTRIFDLWMKKQKNDVQSS